MKPALSRSLWCLAAIDLLLGALLVLAPGLWQEALHPAAMGTTAYPLQRTGALWLTRGAVTAWAVAGRRPQWAAGVALCWGLEAPGDLLLAWRVSDTGPWTGPAYLGRALLALAVAFKLGRAARAADREGAADHG